MNETDKEQFKNVFEQFQHETKFSEKTNIKGPAVEEACLNFFIWLKESGLFDLEMYR